MAKMWAGRTSGVTDSIADDFNSSIRFDCKMYRQDITGSMAHAAMLGAKGIIARQEADTLIDGRQGILEDLDSGKLVVKSGQIDYDVTAIQGWATEKATERMDNLLSGFYSDDKLDAALVAADCLAMGVIPSLENAGYGMGDLAFPVVTGQDAELAAVKNIKAGKQSMTAFLDAGKLVDIIVPLVTDLLAGKEVTPTSTYNNEVIDVPALTYEPYAITADNVDYLVEVGFFTADQIG